MIRSLLLLSFLFALPEAISDEPGTLNQKADGYRGIWYMNQPSGDEYVYKYSGGLGTYCAKHQPFAVYSEKANKTFFCYGGATKENNRQLVHMVSYFDHKTGLVPRPTILLDKQTSDAHDNPVISIDDEGFIWIFSTSHGRSRPSWIHRSKRPFDIDEFEWIQATRDASDAVGEVPIEDDARLPITNFSYMQAWHINNAGFSFFFTRYNAPAKRTLYFSASRDGQQWGRWQQLAAIDEGHYQISGVGGDRLASVFNYHPNGKGLNYRTNLYYLETRNHGKSWCNADGEPVELPVTEVKNPALVKDFESEGKLVYLKDLQFDEMDRPVILFVTSKGYQAGPENGPREWWIARKGPGKGNLWNFNKVTESDNNYDFGSLWIKGQDDWRVIGPTEPGPQPYNPGGEVAMWQSRDQGRSWNKLATMTESSQMNHTYVRRPVNAHEDFYAFWADGHGRQPSESRLYFANQQGTVFQLPQAMNSDSMKPVPVR